MIVAGGPSLTQADVDYCRGRARMIVINNSYKLAPWADIHYFCDPRWMDWHKGDDDWHRFEGFRVTMEAGNKAPTPHLTLRNGGRDGLDERRDYLATGRNSGFQAINLAYHLAVRRILLLGYDMKPTKDGRIHWHPEHSTATKPTIFATTFRPAMKSLVEPLRRQGVEVINVTRDTALEWFPVKQLEDVL